MSQRQKQRTNENRARRLGSGDGIARHGRGPVGKSGPGGVPAWAWVVGGAILVAAIAVVAALLVTRGGSSSSDGNQTPAGDHAAELDCEGGLGQPGHLAAQLHEPAGCADGHEHADGQLDDGLCDALPRPHHDLRGRPQGAGAGPDRHRRGGAAAVADPHPRRHGRDPHGGRREELHAEPPGGLQRLGPAVQLAVHRRLLRRRQDVGGRQAQHAVRRARDEGARRHHDPARARRRRASSPTRATTSQPASNATNASAAPAPPGSTRRAASAARLRGRARRRAR